jgi:hypothetical protein
MTEAGARGNPDACTGTPLLCGFRHLLMGEVLRFEHS